VALFRSLSRNSPQFAAFAVATLRAGAPPMSGRNWASADGTAWVMINVESAPAATTIFVRGELDLVTMPFLAEQLTVVLRDKPGRLVFDLAGTVFMDCASARLIAGAGEWLPEGQRPVIRRPVPAVRRLLELTGLEAYCEIEG
jgi:anti-anti-sigma factor